MWPGTDGPDADEDSLPDIASLTIEPERSPADVIEEMNRLLGVGVRRARYQPSDGPDVSALKAQMGL